MIRKTKDNGDVFLKALKSLTNTDVLVGVPAENADRPAVEGAEGINNATIAYLNETGEPAMNLPARPHILPGVEAIQDQIAEHMKAAAVGALIGDHGAVERAQHKIGLIAQVSIQRKLNEGVPPALSPRTLYRRKHRKESPRQGETPLIDTGEYRNSIRYVIRRRKHGDSHG